MGETETQRLREKPLGDLPTSPKSGMAAWLAKFPRCFLGICRHCIPEREGPTVGPHFCGEEKFAGFFQREF